MSWYITAFCENKAAALARLEEEGVRNSGFRDSGAEALLKSLVEAAGDYSDYGLRLETNGHIGAGSPNSVEVKLLHYPLTRAPSVEVQVMAEPATEDRDFSKTPELG